VEVSDAQTFRKILALKKKTGGDVALAFRRVGDEGEFTSFAPPLPLHGDTTRN